MRIWTTLLLMTSGCTWISQADIDARQGDVDDDGDGFPAWEDCDDDNAAINPNIEEIWYDGIDANCSGDDDFDADKDGYTPDAYAGLTTEGIDGTGALPSGDCDDNNDAVHPSAADSWYDGIDANCDNVNDYDQDADGFTLDEYAKESGLQGGDCDDNDADYSPGLSETWYDGVDSDCAGDDDFDADADGYVLDEYEGQQTEGIPASGRLEGGDCDDSDSTFAPNAEETWYDGEDYDCAGDNDYDADADGYTPDSYADKAGLPEGDCDDNDAEVKPSAIEVLSDPRDLDCDGDGTSLYALEFSEFTGWEMPMNPRFDQNADAIFLSLSAIEVTVDSSTYYDSAMAIALDLDDPLSGLLDIYPWNDFLLDPSAFTLAPGHDFVVTNGYLFGVTAIESVGDQRTLYLGRYNFSTDTKDGIQLNASVTESFEDISLAQDPSGNLYGIGCDSTSGIGQFFSTSLASAASTNMVFDNEHTIEDLYASACELHLYDDPTGTLISAQSDGLVTETFDTDDEDLTLTQVSVNSTHSSSFIEVPEGGDSALTVIADPIALYVLEGDTVLLTHTMATAPVSLDATYGSDGDDMVIAYVDDTGVAHLLIGDPTTGAMDEYTVTTEFSATGAATWVNNNVISVAVIGSSELAIGAAQL
jgi:hypothetical protein